ncbi:MAG: hypothetical protein EZS28_011729 [Streblomastix strix]|uniref:Uncharacterized protein n=1 Tax=Streblomastix strix TaxID=222440 RepID=A0A5J4WCR9_9EUKA|nr:MAG: hypothetical protein EZS28_011729 [Streblomastix strix]
MVIDNPVEVIDHSFGTYDNPFANAIFPVYLDMRSGNSKLKYKRSPKQGRKDKKKCFGRRLEYIQMNPATAQMSKTKHSDRHPQPGKQKPTPKYKGRRARGRLWLIAPHEKEIRSALMRMAPQKMDNRLGKLKYSIVQ